MTGWKVIEGDCVEVMAAMPDASVDAVVTDPPYGLEFMGKEWDRLDGSNGYRRASNPADVGRVDVFGRTSARGPEYVAGRRMQEWHERWACEALRVLKPGGHLLAFGGTRTYHRLVCAVEDAGFEIRDTIAWLYGSGFPKSLDVSKAIDRTSGCPECGGSGRKANGSDVSGGILVSTGGAADATPARQECRQCKGTGKATRPVIGTRILTGTAARTADDLGAGAFSPSTSDGRLKDAARLEYADTAPATPEAERWQGWGTALKPSHEPIVVARKPLVGTVARNVLEHGTGALNVDGCRIDMGEDYDPTKRQRQQRADGAVQFGAAGLIGSAIPTYNAGGRWPANCVLSHSPECRQVGTRRVKRNEPIDNSAAGPDSRGWSGGWAKGVSAGSRDETVPAWECVPGCAVRLLDEQSGDMRDGVAVQRNAGGQAIFGGIAGGGNGVGARPDAGYGGSGGASRFFPTFAADDSRMRYVAKSSSAERNAGLDGFEERTVQSGCAGDMPTDDRGIDRDRFKVTQRNVHPTVKPIELMRWLVRLVGGQKGSVILDPFAGSGTTGIACALEGFRFVGIERDPEYVQIAEARIRWWSEHPDGMKLVDRLEAERERKAVAESGQLDLLGGS